MTPHTIVGVTVLSDPYQFVEIEGDCTAAPCYESGSVNALKATALHVISPT